MNFKQLVREVKFHNDLTNKGVADRIGYSEYTVQSLETGRHTNPSFNVVKCLAMLHPKKLKVLEEIK